MDRGPLSLDAVDPDPSTVSLRDSLGDVETQSAAASITARLLPIAVEDVRQIFRRNSRTGIRDREVIEPAKPSIVAIRAPRTSHPGRFDSSAGGGAAAPDDASSESTARTGYEKFSRRQDLCALTRSAGLAIRAKRS